MFMRESKFLLGFATGSCALLLAMLPLKLADATEPNGAIEPAAIPVDPPKNPDPVAPHVSTTRTGVLGTTDGLTLRLITDLGSVKIIPLEAGAAPEVRYVVHIETDAREPLAQKLLNGYMVSAKSNSSGIEITGNLPRKATRAAGVGAQFWVQFEVTIPRNYSLQVRTEAGDIETQDIGGTADLSTQGGNIRTGRIGGSLTYRNVSTGHPIAKLETQGGHIQVQDVAGDLTAFTAGGHIVAGKISGDASLHSGGGHIRAEKIGGRADLQTDGGNITVGQASNIVSVRTGGGQIDFGEVRGSVRAQTGGGGIRVMYVSGPMEVESSAGSICLTRVASTVRAATAGGTITAWINPDSSSSPNSYGKTLYLAGASQLTSGRGDIVVFLPRNLAADIDATVESGGVQHIQADPELALTFQSSSGDGPVRAIGALHGGGAPLRLHTTAGTIRLRFLDSEMALRESLIRDQKERLMENFDGFSAMPATFSTSDNSPSTTDLNESFNEKNDWLDSWLGKLQVTLLGAVREDSDEFQKSLVYSPRPVYPDIARRVGVQGMVRLQVRARKDGHVEVEKAIDGDPVLVEAATEAVKLWKAKPAWLNGKKVDAISTVTFNFQLH